MKYKKISLKNFSVTYGDSEVFKEKRGLTMDLEIDSFLLNQFDVLDPHSGLKEEKRLKGINGLSKQHVTINLCPHIHIPFCQNINDKSTLFRLCLSIPIFCNECNVLMLITFDPSY